MTVSSIEHRGLSARTLDRRNQVCSPGRTFLCGPGDRSETDEEWGAHIRHRANASPSEQSRHENSSAELPRLSHTEDERVYSLQAYTGDISPTRTLLTHFELNPSHAVLSECHSTSSRSSQCSWLHRVSLSASSSSSSSSGSSSF